MNIIKIAIYTATTGKTPFLDWQRKLEVKTRAIVRTRIDRVGIGTYSPGYRIYFGMQGALVVVLLVGGDKGSQIRDIAKAKQYWLECKELL